MTKVKELVIDVKTGQKTIIEVDLVPSIPTPPAPEVDFSDVEKLVTWAKLQGVIV